MKTLPPFLPKKSMADTCLVLVLAVMLGLSVPQLAAAQLPEAEVDFYVESPEGGQPLTVGDQITLRLEINHPPDSRVVLPQVEEQWDAFKVVEQSSPEIVENEDGTLTTGKTIVVTVFQPGQFQTPTLVVTHRKPDESVEELAAPVVQINITSVLTEDLDLRDLKAQAALPLPAIWPYVVGGLLLTMLVLGSMAGAALWYYHRWRQKMAPGLGLTPVVDPRPPQVIAHAELDRIEALNLPAQNMFKEHYTLVSNCLRTYIEGVYQIPALEQTTTEVRHGFWRLAVPVREMSGFMTILSESDLVKFARFKPQPGDSAALIGNARAVIDATTPRPEPKAPAIPESNIEEAA
jgi:hypothetical protein